MLVKYLNSGWEDSNFERKLQLLIDEVENERHYSDPIYETAYWKYKYYDIKISSKGNHCMVIFKEQKI